MERLISFLKRVIRIFSKNTIKQVLHIEPAISDRMAAAIRLWDLLYRDKPPWLSEEVKSLNLAGAIASETARLVTIEMHSDISGSQRADFLNAAYQTVLADVRNCTEYACAKGGLIFKPYAAENDIRVDYVQADSFIPTAFDTSGNITGAVFFDKRYVGDKIYTRMEYHSIQNTNYSIQNYAFVSSTETEVGKPVPLDSVDAWAGLQPEINLTGVAAPLFAYFKMPMANTVDPSSPLGVSVYARAIPQIQEADRQYSRFLWEFESGERALYVDEAAMRRDEEGRMILPDKRLYRLLNSGDDTLFQDWTPTLREGNILAGLDAILRRVEFNCGLAYGTLSDVQNTDKTAEEIRASKQRSYAHVADIQKALQSALTKLAAAMDTLADLYDLAPAGEYDMTFEFDDSIVSDRQAEFAEKLQLVSSGIMQDWEFRMWYFGEDEETAKGNVSTEFDGVPEI